VAEAETVLAEDPVRAGHLLGRALGLWRGRAYADYPYEEFAQAESRRLEELRLAAISLRLDADLALGNCAKAVAELEALVLEHPLREKLWEQLMTALYLSGRQPDALRAYQRARAAFSELGTEPSAELARLEERILLRDVALESQSVPPRPSGDRQWSRPMQRSSFIGREHELEAAGRLLAECRLFTVTGPPGSGKTRLACRVAEQHATEFPHGTFFVALAAVTDADLVETAIAHGIGLHETPGYTVREGLFAYLRDRRTLLILDNFEQVRDAAPLVGDILDAAPGVVVMVTSREPLGLSGEQEFPLSPLGVPPIAADFEDLADFDAVALFVARARSSDPRFRLTADNARHIQQITQRLDGLPLAIELAAARIKLLTPAELLKRLTGHLDVLSGGPADAASHHRTLRDAIAWSYELLDPAEQQLFRRLGVFRGFTLEAAAEVADEGEAIVFDGVASLLAKSLIYRSLCEGIPRFAMLETLRDYAVEELERAGELEIMQRRHAEHCARVAGECEAQLTRDPNGEPVRLLAGEADNLRLALRFAIDADEAELGLELASRIWRFWECTGQLTEGRRWLEILLSRDSGGRETRARGLSALAGLAYWQADYDEAWARYQEVLALQRTAPDPQSEADTLFDLSMTATWRGDPAEGARLAGEAEAMRAGIGAPDDTGKILMARAWALQRQGDFAVARNLWEQALERSRVGGDTHMAITVVLGLAANEYHVGDPLQALRLAVAAMDEAYGAKIMQLALWALRVTAAIAATPLPAAAARLGSAAEALLREAGGGMPIEPLDLEPAAATARISLSDEDFGEAWADGASLSLDQAVESAHHVVRLQIDSTGDDQRSAQLGR
jgi:predicted ATPase